MRNVYIATEDALSEAVATRLIEENHNMHVAVSVGKKGNGYLRKNIDTFRNIATSLPVILLTDLDRSECPASLINSWCRNIQLPRTFLFRVVVHETEAWLMADRSGFANFTGIPVDKIPMHPEELADPKNSLLTLVRRYAKKEIKDDILPERGSSAKIGLAYNQALCSFVNTSWSIESASHVAESLRRARSRLHELRMHLFSD
jgi:hypothetical protein